MKHKYAKRIAIYSIIFGILSFFLVNVRSNATLLGDGITIIVFIIKITLIITGFKILNRIKNGFENNQRQIYILLGIYGCWVLAAIIILFISFPISIIMGLFVIFPLYSGIKYLLYKDENIIEKSI